MTDYEMDYNIFRNLKYKDYGNSFNNVDSKNIYIFLFIFFISFILCSKDLFQGASEKAETNKKETKPSCKKCNNKENLNNLVLRYETENFGDFLEKKR